jgi:hypothetical protein
LSSEELKLGFLAFLEDFFFLSRFEDFFFLGIDSSLLDGGSLGGGPLLLDCLATNGVAKGYVKGLVDGICPVGIAIDGMGVEVDKGGVVWWRVVLHVPFFFIFAKQWRNLIDFRVCLR